MANRLERIRGWFRYQGSGGAIANARGELERRAAEHVMLTALEGRVPVVGTPEVAAA